MNHKELLYYHAPHISYPIYDMDLDFASYILKNRELVTQYRTDLTDENAELIIQANSPFEYRPHSPVSTGALLVHGLFDTPFIMQDIGKSLAPLNLLIRSILLPGHGTVPSALTQVKCEDYLQTVRYGIASLKKEVEHIFLIGYSMGALINLYLAYEDPEKIAGLIMLCPAYRINSPFAFMSHWPNKLARYFPRLGWLSMTKEIDYAHYLSVPFYPVYQVYSLTQKIKQIEKTKKMNLPIFMVLTYEDSIVDSKVGLNIFDSYPNSGNKMILYSAKPLSLQNPKIILRNSQYPELKIINFSHVAVPISSSNPHYGLHGDLPTASHVEKHTNYLYGELDKPQQVFYDLLYKLKLTHYRHKRLSFNPDFEFMSQEISQFISSLKT